MAKFARFRCYEGNGSQRIGHFTACHFEELTGAAPHVPPGTRDHPFPLDRADALELLDTWNRKSNYGGFRRCFVLEL